MSKKSTLETEIVEASALSGNDIDRMFALYSAHYADTNRDQFSRDLEAKTHAVVLRDEFERIQGFSTLKAYETVWREEVVRVIFSGDTIIEPEHWGGQKLSFAWIRFAGQIKQQAPESRLFWLLICKGHRTYRYLRAFAREYIPQVDSMPAANTVELLEHMAIEQFGPVFDREKGLLKFGTPRGRLKPELAIVPDHHRHLPEVAFFLARNPGYVQGDELVCLCELSSANLRPLARRLFSTQ